MNGIGYTAVCAGLLAALAFLGYRIRHGYRELKNSCTGWECYPLRLKYTGGELAETARETAAYRKAVRTQLFRWLAVWPLLAAVLAAAGRNTAQSKALLPAMNTAAVLSCIFGFAETLLLMKRFEKTEPPRKPQSAAVPCAAGIAKWTCLILWSLGLFVNLVWRGWLL